MKDAILKRLEKLGDGVSFADLSKIDGFNGDLWYGFPEKNVYYWFSCSDKAIDALNELIYERKVALRPTVSLVYLADRLIPKFPTAKTFRNYVGTRWLPVVLDKGANFNKRHLTVNT